MKKLLCAIAVVLGLAAPASAQQQTVKLCVPTSGTACPVVTATAPLPVTGTFSASVAGFTPNGNYNTLTATAASSASTAMPAGTVVAFQNLSTVDVSCVLATGTATATTNKIIVRGGATVYLTVGSNVNAACINQTGSASNVVAMAGGAGLGTNFGGGGGGGGGAVTLASGAVASGAYSSGSIASGAFASGSIASGAMVDLGAQADAACGTATGTCSLIGLVKYLNVSANSSIPAGTALIGDVNLRQGGAALSATNGIYTNLLQGNAVLSATNGLYFNQLQGNAALSVSNPSFATITPTATGGWTPWSTPANNSNTALTNTVVSVKASAAGRFGGYFISNPNATVACMQVFDVATSGGVTLGTTRPTMAICIPATSAANWEITNGTAMANGIQIAATTTASGSTAPSTGLDVTVLYK